MAFVIADRVRESSTTTGTGNFTLGGAVTGYQTFDAVLDSGDTTYYTIADQGGANWEVGIGTFTSPSTLARTTILSSSNGGSIVTFTAGTKDVFISLPASKTNTNDQPNVISVNSTSNALRITQTGTGNALVVEDSTNPDATPFVVDASGNVGIGTSSPGALLQLNKGSGAADFRLSVAGTLYGNIYASSSDMTINSVTAIPLTLGTNNTERMRIDSSGNVGIGTSSPGNKLDIVSAGSSQIRVKDGVNATAYYDFGRDGTDGFFGFSGAQTTFSGYKWSVNAGSEVMRITNGGNVGIGTTTPTALLDVNGSVAITGTARRITGDFSNATQTNRIFFQTTTSGGGTSVGAIPNATGGNSAFNAFGSPDPANSSFAQLRAGADTSDVRLTSGITGTGTYYPFTFYTGGSERMRLDTSGNALINTTTAVSKLTVNGDVAGTFFVNPTTVSANYTIPTNYNAMTAGPISINSGITVTVPSGSTWSIV